MIGHFLRLAHQLDAWLERRLGRPYHVALGIGLVVEIIGRLRDLAALRHSAGGVLRLLIAVAFFGFLLLHQLGELHAHAARRRDDAEE